MTIEPEIGAAAAVATLLTGAMPYWLPHAVVVLLGLSAVSGVQLKLPLAVIYAVCGGFAAGISAELENVSIPVLTGAAITVGFATLACITGLNDLLKVNRFKAVTLLARRVVGSWIATIGLLMGALAVRMHNG